MNQEEQGFSMLNELVQLFHLVAEMNRKKVSKLQNKSLASSLECD